MLQSCARAIMEFPAKTENQRKKRWRLQPATSNLTSSKSKERDCGHLIEFEPQEVAAVHPESETTSKESQQRFETALGQW